MSYDIVMIPGDGIGPEIMEASRRVIAATGVDINWIVKEAGGAQIEKHGSPIPPETVEAIRQYGVAYKGPITTPVGTGFRSVNVVMRRELDLYANVRPSRSYPNVPSRFANVDLVVVRENTEDLYAGIEHMIGDVAAESIKLITRKGCERIVRYAFDYAVQNGRRKVTAVHKANIMKCTDGLFLSVAREIAQEYPEIEFDDMIIDAMCMRLVQTPEKYDVLVMPNLCAGLVGGPGLAPSANIGQGKAIFEAVHGSAPQIAGQNIANPTALILSGAMLLRHIGEPAAAQKIEDAVRDIIAEGKELTQDLGGKLGTKEFADALIARMS